MHRDGRLKVGWFHQHQIEALEPMDTPLDLMRQMLPEATEASRRSRLAQYGLGASKAETQHKDLSGGERARLLLNLVAAQGPHLLILDEPTNHLDIDSRRALLDALNDYEGAVVLITHDRSLMELVADRLWLAADGGIHPFEGDLDDYSKFVLDRAKRTARAEKGRRPGRPAQERQEGGRPGPRPASAAEEGARGHRGQGSAASPRPCPRSRSPWPTRRTSSAPNELAQLGRDRRAQPRQPGEGRG